MMYPLVLDLADDGVRVAVTCRVLGFSTQAFDKRRKAPISQRDWDDAHLINAARDIHVDDAASATGSSTDKTHHLSGGTSHRCVHLLIGEPTSRETFCDP
jgi:hypothetical protein